MPDPENLDTLPHPRRRPAPAENRLWLDKDQPPPPFDPRVEADLSKAPEWFFEFVEHLSVSGSQTLALAYARVGKTTLYRWVDKYPEWQEAIFAARQYYKELIEWESVRLARTKDNPLPFFARLKAEMPERYIERSISLSLQAETQPISAEEAAKLLRAALTEITPTTRAKLEAMGALPEHAGAHEPEDDAS